MPTLRTLFSGGELFGVGAQQAGYTHADGYELDPKIAAVAQLNGFDVRVADVCAVDYAALPTVNHLHASPSCKNASNANQKGVDENGDPLPRETEQDLACADAVCRAIAAHQGETFTLENVYGYRTFQSFDRIREALLDSMSAESKKTRHLGLAEALTAAFTASSSSLPGAAGRLAVLAIPDWTEEMEEWMICLASRSSLAPSDQQRLAQLQAQARQLVEQEQSLDELNAQRADIAARQRLVGGQVQEADRRILALQAEVLELRANPNKLASGIVIEAKLDKGRGPVATVLVQRGTLKRGDVFVVGEQSGKVRALINDKGKQVNEAGPSIPVEVLGLTGVPSAGDKLTVVENEQRAREVADYRRQKALEKRTTMAPASIDTMFSALSANRAKEYPVLVKGDVQGSVEAIVGSLNKISTDDIKARVLHSGVGAITESDVTLAKASNAPIIGFNVRANAQARALAERDGVRFKYFDIIYDLLDDIKGEMAGVLGPERIETVVGRAEIKEIFPAGKKDKAAGLLVTDGFIRKGLYARITRDDVIVSKTSIASLRRFKDDVAEVRAGLECGVVLQDTNDIKPGDILETFDVEMRDRTL